MSEKQTQKRLIIAGGRTFTDYEFLKKEVLQFILDEIKTKNIEIVSGKARGTDSLGERFADEYKLPVKEFHADWKKYGSFAGPFRNEQMAKYATHAICFWNGESRGTLSMISFAKEYQLVLKIVKI